MHPLTPASWLTIRFIVATNDDTIKIERVAKPISPVIIVTIIIIYYYYYYNYINKYKKNTLTH